MVWFDTGTINSLFSASEFVKVIELRTNKKIACIEEIAYLHNYIGKEHLLESVKKYGKSEYAVYLKELIDGRNKIFSKISG